jgi:hypothetical protein
MVKIPSLFKKERRGEAAATLTIISFLLLTAGTILGSFVAQQETRTQGKAATGSQIKTLAGYHWNECQLGACIENFDGRTDDNGWCQGYKIRCVRKGGKVCQLPDPWCDGADQGPASTCIGVNQKGTDASQTCSSSGKSCGDGVCSGPNENWETCNAPECPYTLPPAGGQITPTLPTTQCAAEGGICQREEICGVSIPNSYPDPQQKGCPDTYPVCCKLIGATPTLTPTPTGSLTPTLTPTPINRNAVVLVMEITTNNTKPYTQASVIGCLDENGSNCQTIDLYNDINSPILNNSSYTKIIDNLHADTTYYVKVEIKNGQTKLYEDLSYYPVVVPNTVTFEINLLNNSSTIFSSLSYSYTPADYKKVMDGYISGQFSAIQISEWVARATNSPGIKIKFCDPLKGECNIPF